jgi:hypothetical protein
MNIPFHTCCRNEDITSYKNEVDTGFADFKIVNFVDKSGGKVLDSIKT